jgi:phosphoenolpyruvate synthase/pyruvate phosphate dikinase
MIDSPVLLRGNPASPGVGRGRLRIVRSPLAAQTLRPGEVLVIPTAERLWRRWFITAAAVVSHTGGSLCTSAQFARRYCLPAVFGVGDDLWDLRDGQLVEVDGTVGTIRLLTGEEYGRRRPLQFRIGATKGPDAIYGFAPGRAR